MREDRPPVGERHPVTDGPTPPHVLETIATRLGSTLRSFGIVTLGTVAETYRIVLGDGRILAVQRRAGRGAARRARAEAALGARLLAAGIPVSGPTSVVPVGGTSWLVAAWVDGESGRGWQDGPERSRRLAMGMGALATRLAEVDPVGLDLDRGWATPAGVGRRATADLRRLEGSLEPDAVRVLERSIDTVRGSFAGVEPVLAHGDLAPVNVIVAPDGTIRALLDFEAARVSVPLLDVAWWGWIVRFHHPDAWARTWPVFLAAADVPADRETAAVIDALQRLRCLEMAASGDDPAVRAAWLARLVATLAWGG